MHLEIIAAGVIMGFILGGKLRNLGQIPIKGIWAFVLLGGISLTIMLIKTQERQIILQVLIMISYVVMAYLLLINRGLAGVKTMMCGLVLNLLVMAANGGRMPVSQWAIGILSGTGEQLNALYYGTASRHVLMTDSTNLKVLGDIIPVPIPYLPNTILSIGDIILYGGIIYFIIKGMKGQT